MQNIKLTIAYDGTDFHGWQRQKNDATIQGEIEKCLTRMTATAVTLYGAGRTDAGVHAQGMVGNFHTASKIPCQAFQHSLNSMLPPSIRIIEVSLADPEFHARFSARAKTYCYSFFTGKIQNPVERLYSYHFPWPLHTDTIKNCLKHLVGTHDFTSFEASGSRDLSRPGGRGAVRTMHNASIHRHNEHKYVIQLSGDGFLRHMVRNIVGTLLLPRPGKNQEKDFFSCLKAKDRQTAGPTAPAHGLSLKKIFYD